MTESLVQSKKKRRFLTIKSKIEYRVTLTMLLYWLVINIILAAISCSISSWLILIGFNLGFIGSMIGFFLLLLSSKWLISRVPIKQALSYFSFIIRMIIYGTIIVLAIILNFANIPSIIAGFSILMIATITSELILFKKEKKAM